MFSKVYFLPLPSQEVEGGVSTSLILANYLSIDLRLRLHITNLVIVINR